MHEHRLLGERDSVREMRTTAHRLRPNDSHPKFAHGILLRWLCPARERRVVSSLSSQGKTITVQYSWFLERYRTGARAWVWSYMVT